MIVLRPGDPPLHVGRLPSHFGPPGADASFDVHLAYSAYEHIVTRRGPDARLVLRRMQEVVCRPTHAGRLTADPRRVELYRLSPDEEVGVCISVKCLPGETWVNTGYPIGTRALLKHVRAGRFHVVEGSSVLLIR